MHLLGWIPAVLDSNFLQFVSAALVISNRRANTEYHQHSEHADLLLNVGLSVEVRMPIW